MTSPVPLRNDIISGQEFLSLFIAENPIAESSSTPESAANHHQQQPRGRSLTQTPQRQNASSHDDEQSNTVNAFEGELGNDIIPTSDKSQTDKPQSTPLVTIGRDVTTTTTNSTSRSQSQTRSSSSSTAPPLATNKRIIVRKFVNVHSRSRNTKTNHQQPAPTTTGSTRSNNIYSKTTKSQDTNYLDETADQTPPINSHRSESLFIEEADAKDLTNSESMNVPRIVKLPPTTTASTSTNTETGSLPPQSSSSSRPLQPSMRLVNEGPASLPSSVDNESRQRNSPFTLQRSVTAATKSTSSGSKQVTAEEDDDLESNASNNDQLVQQRMSTSRSRTQRKQIDTSSAIPSLPSSASLSSYQTVVYGNIQQQASGAASARLPVPRSISSYPSREQKIAPSGPLYQARVYSEPAKVYSEPAKVYSEPAKVYSEPAKVYGQPEKVYSEPAKYYSEPAKIYSEPAKFYSEPAKVYSEPARNYGVPPTPFPTTTTTSTTTPKVPSTTSRKILFNLDKLPYDLLNAPNRNLDLQSNDQQETGQAKSVHMEELFYNSKPPQTGQVTNAEVDSLHEDQQSNDEVVEEQGDQVELDEEQQGEEKNGEGSVKSQTKNGDNNKTGYVVEGRTYRKYRVEEKTPDGFIVGEYGVVSHNDGNLRGVRYTADSNINPRLIYDALLKFLSL